MSASTRPAIGLRLTAHAYAPGDSAPPAWLPSGARRRIDPLARLACSAIDRLAGATAALPRGWLDADTALIVSTSYGAVESTWRFLDGIARYGDAGASPTPFTTSVHSSCAGSVGELLGLHGPCTTISQGQTGTIAALRCAALLLAAGRAPRALLLIGDRHNDWSRRVVAELIGGRMTVGDGMVAALVESGPGSGRELRLGRHAADLSLDGGAVDAADEALLAAAPEPRRSAPTRIGSWWPCCALAALDDADARAAVLLREAEDGRLVEAWLGPRSEAADRR